MIPAPVLNATKVHGPMISDDYVLEQQRHMNILKNDILIRWRLEVLTNKRVEKAELKEFQTNEVRK